MSLSKAEQVAEIARKELRPKKPIVDVKDLSQYKFKDEFFNKDYQYFDKMGNPKSFTADWRSFFIGGTHIIAYKNDPISKVELEAMKSDGKAVDYYLEKIKSKKKSEPKIED